MIKSKFQEAITLLTYGWHVFPVWGLVAGGFCECGQTHKDNPKGRGKHPITKNGHNDATTDKEQIRKWWEQYPNANIGVATGVKSGVCVLDIDPDNGGNISIQSYPEIPTTVQVLSGGGGRHYYFKYNKAIKSGNGSLGFGLDIKSDGGYIISPPSSHFSGNKYEWITDQSPFEIEMADAPIWMRVEVKEDFRNKEIYKLGERDNALTSMAGRFRRAGSKEDEIERALLELNRSRCQPPLSDEQVKKIAKSVIRYAKDDTKKEGKLEKTISIMESDNTLCELFRFNLFTKDIEYTISPLFSYLKRDGDVLNDKDFIEIKYYISKTHGYEVTINTIIEACILMSLRNTHHPVCDYINNLKWDGIPRVGTWLTDYCGCDENEYIKAVGRKVLVAAISRIFNPGAKFDFMMILEGAQGIGKSQMVEALGGQWYLDTDIKERNKDTVDKMRGAWIIEISELVGFSKSDVESLKAFISRRVDRERLSYEKTRVDFPRQCIFIGTHNPSGDNTYFYDDTGNRRFWPVKCKKTDYRGVSSVRDQLFAEAKVLHDSGEKLYLDDLLQIQMALNEQEERKAVDPWTFSIEEYLIGKHMATGKDILGTALGIPKERHFKESLMKVGRIMKDLEWVKKRESTGQRKWYYERIEEEKKTTMHELRELDV